jgi:ABC-type Fe3+ transport system permease subunit
MPRQREVQMYRIRRFGVLRTWVSAVMYFVLFAVILVPLLLLAGAAGVRGQPGTEELQELGPLGLALAGLLGSAIYALLAFVFVALTCLLYNLVARFTGGIEVQVERREPPTPAPLPASWNRPQGPGQSWGGSPPLGSAG